MSAPTDIKIRAVPQVEPTMCDFKLESPVVEHGVYRLTSSLDQSPLAKSLFEIDGITEVTLVGSTISIKKSNESEPWPVVGKKIGSAIRSALSSGEPIVSEEMKQKTETEKELFKKVQGILANKINPAVASHGGYIEILDVVNSDVFIRMGGGCQGCASSTATLKQGVEGALRDELPELGAIIDTTDHSAGTNPFY